MSDLLRDRTRQDVFARLYITYKVPERIQTVPRQKDGHRKPVATRKR